MKGALSSFELRHVVHELQLLCGAKVEKIFQQEKPVDDFLFSLHVSGKGKQLLYVSLPRLLCLSLFKPTFPDAPPGFCTALRRKITNARITAITQHHFERIVKIELSTKHGPSTLIIEFISPGNMLLVDEEYKILSVLRAKIWSKERKLLPGKTYVFPPAQVDPAALSLEQFTELLSASTKESIVKSLAIDCSLGGLYAEEVVKRANIEKNKSPAHLSADEQAALFNALHHLFAQKTQAYTFNKEAVPIKLLDAQEAFSPQPSFNEAIAKLALADLEREEYKEHTKQSTTQLSKTEKVIAKQEQVLAGLEAKAKEQQQKAEAIYHHYAEIKLLLDKIIELRKVSSWKEIKELCKDIDFVTGIDEKTGTITIKVDE